MFVASIQVIESSRWSHSSSQHLVGLVGKRELKWEMGKSVSQFSPMEVSPTALGVTEEAVKRASWSHGATAWHGAHERHNLTSGLLAQGWGPSHWAEQKG